jgi:glycyl-tRNA synthetase alpha chain
VDRWAAGPGHYGDVFHQNEVEMSTYNFEHADTAALFGWFDTCEIRKQAPDRTGSTPARLRNDLKASHTFNLLDARKAISVTERQRYILRVRALARAVAQAYYDARAALGVSPCVPASATRPTIRRRLMSDTAIC